MSFVIVAAGLALIVALGLLTRRGVLFVIWPVIFAYPHRLTLGALPWNAGFDDVAILAWFLVLLLKGEIRGLGFLSRMAFILFLVALFSEATGLMINGAGYLAPTIKVVLKRVVLVVFMICLDATLRSERDVKGMFLGWAIGMALACGTALADFYGLEIAKLFYVTMTEEQEILRSRASGSFLTADGTGLALMVGLLLVGQYLTRPHPILLRVGALLLCTLMFGTLLGSGSRTGWLSLGVATLGLLMVSRKRVTVLAAFVLAAFVFLSVPMFQEAVVKRLSRTAAQMAEEGGIWVGSGRLIAIDAQIRQSGGPWTFFCGIGDMHMSVMGWYAHNAYVQTILTFGLVGLAWWVALFARLIRQLRFVTRWAPTPFARDLAAGMLWALVGSAVASMTADTVMNTLWRYNIVWFVGAGVGLTRELILVDNPALVGPEDLDPSLAYAG